MTQTATAIAHPNIAFIKYWGNKDNELKIPTNGSISMNLAELVTRTSVTFDESLSEDTLTINNEEISGAGLLRAQELLHRVRKLADFSAHALIESTNNFPMGAGIASSASGFAALTLAATTAARLSLNSDQLSRFARISSGSACRSIPGGYVEWEAGQTHESSYAVSIHPPAHWELVDCLAIIDYAHKAVTSAEGHEIASTSPLQDARVNDSERRLEICRQAIFEKDFHTFAEIVELDSNMMHAVMMTSTPALFYLAPTSIALIQKIKKWRLEEKLEVCYTFDAGPNAHVLCTAKDSDEVIDRLKKLDGVNEVMRCTPGDQARVLKIES